MEWGVFLVVNAYPWAQTSLTVSDQDPYSSKIDITIIPNPINTNNNNNNETQNLITKHSNSNCVQSKCST